VSDGNETNNSASVSRVTGTNEPHIAVLKGNPSDDEVAALIAVLGSVGGGAAEPAQQEHTRWGLPVDKLRYPPFSWQLITLVQRVHMRR
jgi:hypothetical protein